MIELRAAPATRPAETSNWPLSRHGERALLPQAMLAELTENPLTRAFHPLAFGYYPQALGHHMARQQPTDNIVIYCVEGRASVNLPGRQATVRAGDLLWLPAGEPHAYQADTDAPWSLYWIHLGGVEAALQLQQLFGQQTLLHPGLHERLVSDFRALMDCTRASHQTQAFQHAASLCRAILSYTALLLSQPREQSSTLDINALHMQMQARINERLTLAQLAELAGQPSRYQFIRHYRAHTGQTPVQAFLHMKIARACYLLETSRLSVADIAHQLGVDDPYYFSRLFRKITRVSPARYRRHGMAPPPPPHGDELAAATCGKTSTADY